MGIPKFFRNMSERYPLISQLIEENKIPEFDNLYLDMNGIIHNCSHPNDADAHFRLSEADMFLAIFGYIEHVFTKIKPQKLFFLAVDGVAPRAKMNQQRSRRFRTAKEAKDVREKALRRGEELPEEDAFDSNCITPGTPFMTRLSAQLKYFLARKVTDDAAWRGVEIVLSGHEVPGEGEHKIMEYIRLAKAQPGYNPNVRHCLYGLDADLIMLGLLSHDPHFALLREEVSFGPQRKKKASLEQQNFYLLHLSLFREYLDLEFQDLRSTLPFEYSLERIIDDFILLNIFVGNDFLPHLPGMHINEGALPLLFSIYKKVLPSAGGYFNEDGRLRTDRLQLVLAELNKVEQEQFEEEMSDMSWVKRKAGKNNKAAEKSRAKGNVVLTAQQRVMFGKVQSFLLAQREDPAGAAREMFLPGKASAEDKRFLSNLAKDLRLEISFDEYDPEEDAPAIAVSNDSTLLGDDVDLEESAQAVDRVLGKYQKAKTEDVDDEYDAEEEYSKIVKQKMDEWKRAYYKDKMHIDYDDEEQMKQLAFRYVEGLQWVLHYYYDGVASWGWFYDYHYCPKISDLRNVGDMKFNFELGKPFRPFDQLMGVLPPLSSQHIPEAYRDLMTDPASSIKDFYPMNFEADLNGKKQDWEAVVKIPFIDEKRLLEALDKREGRLTSDEKQRNTMGTSTLITYDGTREHLYPSSLPGMFPDIVHCHAKLEEFHLPILDGLHLVKGLCDGVELGARALAGFPSIKTLPHYGRMGHHGVNVFQSESKGESMVIHVENTFEDNKPEQLAEDLVGKRTFITWPFLREGLVTAVSDHLFKYEMGLVGGQKKIVANPHKPDYVGTWKRKAERIEHHYSKRYGVLIGSVEILLHVRPLKGLRRMDDGSFLKNYEEDADKEVEQAIQVSVQDVVQEDARFKERPALPIPQEFPEQSKVFFLGHHAYGSPATVEATSKSYTAIKLVVFANQAREAAQLHELVSSRTQEKYYPSFSLSKKLGISGLALSKITSSMLVEEPGRGSRVNIGLNLKFEAKGHKVLGYSRKSASGWEFSDRTVALISEYRKLFPEIIQALMDRPKEDLRDAHQFFGDAAESKMKKLKDWIKEKGVRDLEAVPLFSEQLDKQSVHSIEVFTENVARKRTPDSVKHVMLSKIPRTALLKPAHGAYRLGGQRFELGDRVVSVADTGMVPMSARGVVIGLNSTSIDVVFDVPFLAGHTLDDRCRPYRGATVGFATVLNLTQPQFEQFDSNDKAAANTKPVPALSPLERTLGPDAFTNGSVPKQGRTLGAPPTNQFGTPNYRPPNAFKPAPSYQKYQQQQEQTPGVQILRRGIPGGRGGAASVQSDVRFSHVTSGQARPSRQANGRGNANGQADINPHLAALSLNGHAGGMNGGRGGLRPRENGTHQTNGHAAGAPANAPSAPRGGGGGRGARGRGGRGSAGSARGRGGHVDVAASASH